MIQSYENKNHALNVRQSPVHAKDSTVPNTSINQQHPGNLELRRNSRVLTYVENKLSSAVFCAYDLDLYNQVLLKILSVFFVVIYLECVYVY